MRFRPLMGIILFNFFAIEIGYAINTKNSFRPLMGIILFNEIFCIKCYRFRITIMFPSPNGDYFI